MRNTEEDTTQEKGEFIRIDAGSTRRQQADVLNLVEQQVRWDDADQAEDLAEQTGRVSGPGAEHHLHGARAGPGSGRVEAGVSS